MNPIRATVAEVSLTRSHPSSDDSWFAFVVPMWMNHVMQVGMLALANSTGTHFFPPVRGPR